MAEYYVVRDKNTGLYFRGKGVNRWGKHYNQASIYRVKGQAECTVKDVSWHGEQAEIVPIQIFDNATDVVPVVRCKDCKHCKKHPTSDRVKMCTNEQQWATECYPLVHDDDFCSYGERRSE